MRIFFACLFLCLFSCPVTAQWLSQGEHGAIWDMWPAGVPCPDTLKFYSLPKASQRIATTDNRPSFGFHAVTESQNINSEFPYAVSGGMDWVDRAMWRNVTGLSIPKGKKISVWVAKKDVLNSFGRFQSEFALFWAFPDGTQVFDVLIHKKPDGQEHIFTVRVREKNGTWENQSYFPQVVTGEYADYHHPGNSTTRNIFGVEKITYRTAKARILFPFRKYIFKESKIAITDDGVFFPKGFVGHGMACSKCHVTGMNNEKTPYAGPELRGRDTVFSWYPVTLDSIVKNKVGGEYYQPRLDSRWPIQMKE